MFKVFNPSIIGIFFKEKRIQNGLTIQDLCNRTYYSPATISHLENTTEILDKEKVKIILKALYLPTDYFDIIDHSLNQLVDNLIESFIYIDSINLQKAYEKLENLFVPYKDSPLNACFDFCTLLYNTFFEKKINKKTVQNIIKYQNCFTTPIQCLSNLYIGYYYLKQREKEKAEFYYHSALSKCDMSHNYNQMTNYCVSIYYYKIGNIFDSLIYINRSKNDFIMHENYKRLVNINILSALQYMSLHYFSKANDIYTSCLSTIDKMNLKYEKRIVLYNMAFIHTIEEKYDSSYTLLTQIPHELLKCKHYFALTYNLYQLGDYETAKKMCKKGIEIADDKIYDKLLNEFDIFFKKNDYRNLTNKIIKIYQNSKQKLEPLTKEYFLLMIIKLCKQTNQQKRAIYFLEELYFIQTK